MLKKFSAMDRDRDVDISFWIDSNYVNFFTEAFPPTGFAKNGLSGREYVIAYGFN